MGLFRRSIENPSVPLSAGGVAQWLGRARTAAGVEVSEDTVYGMTAYYRAVVLTAGTIAGLPLKVYRKSSRERVAARTVLDSPNPRQTPLEFWMTTYANALSWGNGYAWKRRDGANVVREVWPIHPGRVRIEEDEPTDANPSGKVFIVRMKNGTERRYTDWDVFHMPFLSPSGVQGLSPLQAFTQPLAIGLAAERTAAEFYANGSRLQGLLIGQQELNDTSASRLKRRWKEMVGSGPGTAGDIAVLDSGVKFEPLSIPPADAQVLDSRRFTVSEIARMFGCPPHLLADVERSTSWGTGIEQQVIGWVKFGLGTWLQLGEQRITRELLPGGWDSGTWYAEYSVEGLLRGDSAARAAFYGQGITNGWLTRNEVRALENREPGPDELDDFLTPSNMTLITVDGQIKPLAAAGQDQPPAV